jgi:hypothetical protein
MMDEEKPKRPTWLTLSVLGVVASVGLYVFVIGAEIGTMRQQMVSNEFRITALETHGSGPVQTAAAKVEALTNRADRILEGLLTLQQKMSDLQATQQTQGVILNRLQEDVTKQGANPK